MLYFLVVWFILGSACCLIGTTLLWAMKADCFSRMGDRWIASVWLGLITLNLSLLTLSCLLPLTPIVGWSWILGLACLCLTIKAVRTEITCVITTLTTTQCVAGLAIALIIAIFMTQQVTWIDTGLYHYPLIHWIRDVGLVPGLALLSSQLGYISSWFAIAAPLNPVALEGQVSAVTNGFVVLLMTWQIGIVIYQGFRAQAQLSDWFLLIYSVMTLPVLLGTHLLSTVLVSASPDIVIIFLIGIIAWTMLIISPHLPDLSSSSLTKSLTADLIPLLLSAGAVSIKLIALPLLPISVCFYLFIRGIRWLRVAVGAVLGTLMLSPILAANILTSGCPLYPSPTLCLQLPWSKTAYEAHAMAEATRGWGIWFGSPPENVNPVWWIFQQWFNSIGSSKLIVLLVILSLLSMFYVFWKGKRAHLLTKIPRSQLYPEQSNQKSLMSSGKGLFWLVAIAAVGISFILFYAPLFRFGMGYVVLLPALAIATALCSFLQKQSKFDLPWISTVFNPSSSMHRGMIFLSLGLSMATIVLAIHQTRFFLPPAFDRVEVDVQQVNNVTFFFPKNEKMACWAAQLPCTAEPAADIQLLDPHQGIRAGFIRQILDPN